MTEETEKKITTDCLDWQIAILEAKKNGKTILFQPALEYNEKWLEWTKTFFDFVNYEYKIKD